jgi:hypothetical protein
MIGEHHRGKGAGADPGEFDDAKSAEWSGHCDQSLQQMWFEAVPCGATATTVQPVRFDPSAENAYLISIIGAFWGTAMQRMIVAAAIAILAAGPASAVPRMQAQNNLKQLGLGVTIFEESFLLDLRPVPDPDSLAANHFKSKGGPASATEFDVDYYTLDAGGGLVVSDSTGARFTAFGDQLFTGTTDRPTLRFGRFNFTSDRLGNPITAVLRVTAVPEPASWAMLIAGFGLTGAALRRRRMTARAN